MNNTTPIDARGQNKQGQAIDYLLDTEELPQQLRQHALAGAMSYYYGSDADLETCRYGGKLASDPELALAGKKVDRDVMISLAKGFAPSGKALCQNAGQEPVEVEKRDHLGNVVLDANGQPETLWQGGHRIGYDVTLSAPKPVSVAFALAGPQEQMEILTAHRRAVQKAMDYLESRVETRRGKGGKDAMDIEGLIYTQHDHLSNRDLEPNLHTHNMVYGVCKGVDGEWRTFESEELFRCRQSSDQIYRNELAVEMQKLGYGIEQQVEQDIDGKETGRIWWTINGVSEELCKEFSNRRTEILAYAEEHGVDRQTAWAATRKHKDEPCFAEMQENWKQTYQALAEKNPTLELPDVAALKGRENKFVEVKDDEVILERLHENEAVFGERELIVRIGTEWSGRIGHDELMQKIDEFKQRNSLVTLQGEAIHEDDRGDRPARKHREERYAAGWMVDFEREVVERAQARKDEQGVRVAPETTQKAIEDYEARKGFQLSDEQREAIQHVTCDTGGVAVMSGLAGTGKTTVSDCYSAAFIAEGKRMRGACINNKAAKKLNEESGMECASVAMTLHQLQKGTLKLTDKDVVVLDEAGMVPTRETVSLMRYCQDAGAKLILQGDMKQLQPIGAGSGMSLVKATIGDTMLTEIRRQSKVEDRATAKGYYDQDDQGKVIESGGVKSRAEVLEKSARILNNLIAGNHLDLNRDQEKASQQLVKDYLASPKPTNEKLVLAHSREEVARLNRDIREGLKQRGEIDAAGEVVITTRDNKAKAWVDLPFAPGDLIMFGAKDNDLGVLNGDKGKIEAIKRNYRAGGYDFTVALEGNRPEDCRSITFNHHEYNALSHGIATTVHASQGQGKKQVFHRGHVGMADNQSMLVAFTRQTEEYRLYVSSDELDRLKNRLGMDRMKQNAIDALPQQQAAKALPDLPGAPPPLTFDEAPHQIRRHKVGEFKEAVRQDAAAINEATRPQVQESFQQRLAQRRERARGQQM